MWVADSGVRRQARAREAHRLSWRRTQRRFRVFVGRRYGRAPRRGRSGSTNDAARRCIDAVRPPDDPETRMRVAALEQGLRDPGLGWIAATSASIIAGRPTIPTACAARGRGGGAAAPEVISLPTARRCSRSCASSRPRCQWCAGDRSARERLRAEPGATQRRPHRFH
jgi:hypothetical protein